MLAEFGKILIFFALGVVFVGIGLVSAMLVRPSHPNPIKQSTYECGEIPVGEPWARFNVRFYIVALVFLLFDVEVLFLFPWAVVFKGMGWFAFIEMLVFVLILVAGLAYVWVKGDLDWDKPKPIIPTLDDLIDRKAK